MKKCMNCGAEIEDVSNFCPFCGTRCEDSKGAEEAEHHPAENSNDSSEIKTNPYPMKWHNFLMVVMILSAIATIINGAGILAGSEYMNQGIDMTGVYILYPGLKSCDMFYGVMLIAMGVFQFTVRSRLKHFRANGPGSLKVLYILAIISGLIYMIWATSATKTSYFNSSNLSSIGSSAILLMINSIYYSKRNELFVN